MIITFVQQKHLSQYVTEDVDSESEIGVLGLTFSGLGVSVIIRGVYPTCIFEAFCTTSKVQSLSVPPERLISTAKKRTTLRLFEALRLNRPTGESTLIPFCMRLIEPDKDDDNNRTIDSGTPFTFERLKQLNVTSKDLLQWSASLDIIEKYQIYLVESSSSSNPTSLQIYRNCTQPWFGKLCEYIFDSRFKSFSSFNDIVDLIYRMKLSPELGPQRVLEILQVTNGTSYTGLQCDRTIQSSLGLEWRDICDGK
ncbi:unnamed protein product [Didymodactylos carnosus]|uniref:Uncharacterized protein n=1 Tax=Didymodactylos carnosus TaxID=1234261 RepID=A0A815AQT3_9BILA|nr:unnamed protein product [Didymodactylos carnosus]CAF1268135.1 unnamed protein product [Didymodactylos carnosus]CAF4036759.1 unnamed protein product [Didymodactylos carnosus]CAF4073867.1 unnamed protein product [Didymodactylos carnosus]